MEASVGVSRSNVSLIHEVFEEQVCQYPDAVAVAYRGQSLTYRELSVRSTQLARYLRRAGAGPESRIAICIERSLEMTIGLLGILKAGAAYVPLDPSYPAERLRYMLEDCKPVALLTQDHLQSVLPAGDILQIALDTDWSAIERQSNGRSDELPITLMPDNLAYVIYTSGSTGIPKGVMIDHGNVTCFLKAVRAWFHFEPGCSWALFHSFAFDVSVMEMWGALLSGGRLIVVSYATSRFPRDLYTLLLQEEVEVLCQTPSAFRRLVAAQSTCPGTPSLKSILLAGEALQLNSLGPWYERNANRGVSIANMYGPTETTVYVTYQPLNATDEDPPGGSVIGIPLVNSQIFILDEHRESIPAGEVGEIYIGGLGVARGYLNRADLTAERFVPDQTGVPGRRMYSSGDLGRWQPQGKVEYRGRNDSQVKVRGFRIELGEIEHHLSAVDGVREGVVVAARDTSGELKLVAHVTVRDGAELTGPTVREALLRRLPVHMVPAECRILPQMPLNGSGKIDRKALSLMPAHATSAPAIFTASQRALEERASSSLPPHAGEASQSAVTTC